MVKNKIGVIGAGAYGQALNVLLRENSNNEVVISDVVSKDLSNFVEMEEVLKCDYLVCAIPSKFVLSFLKEYGSRFRLDQKVLIGSKGFSQSGELLSAIFCDFFEVSNVCYLAGPGFANEICENPNITRLNVSGFDLDVAEEVAGLFCSDVCSFSLDVLDFEITSVLKNVAALVCGITFGKFGSLNFKYAVASKVYCEIFSVVEFFGGSGLVSLTNPLLQADLYMTASQVKSRNFKFGGMLSSGRGFRVCVEECDFTVESLDTVKILDLMREKDSKIFEGLVILPNICDLVMERIDVEDFFDVLRKVNFSCCDVERK